MKEKLLSKVTISGILLLFFNALVFAQLPAITLNVTATPQTCLGNGSLSITVIGKDPAATMDYAVYLLPNETSTVYAGSSSTVTGLVAGNYKVVATQSLGGVSNTTVWTGSIGNSVVPLAYNFDDSQNVKCGSDGKIVVTVTSGTAVNFQIVAGPVTRPVQPGGTFANLPAGLYDIKITDNCGEAEVTSYQLIASATTLTIGAVGFPSSRLPSCNSIIVSNMVTCPIGQEIFYPLALEYTVYPPGGGAPIIVTGTVASGLIDQATASSAIPFYHDQQYYYNLKITDACGNVYNRNNNTVRQKFTIALSSATEDCVIKTLTIKPNNYVGPYVVSFIEAPAGFNPVTYYPAHPNYDLEEVVFGGEGSPVPTSVPLGVYKVQVTDACGNTDIKEIEIEEEEVEPSVSGVEATCDGFGAISITIPGRTIVSVKITDAPADYTAPLPHDVSVFIGPNGFEMGSLPVGEYTFEILDSCNETHITEGEVPPFAANPALSKTQRQGCEAGYGSIRMTSPHGTLTSVIITSGPASFATYPYDVSMNIATNGQFFMNGLPAGNYVFKSVDSCNTERIETVAITGYIITNNNLAVSANCNSFNLLLEHTSNGDYVQSFWLQKFNETSNSWGHPSTGIAYAEGTLPAVNNSLLLQNNFNNINLMFTGSFRVIKVFHNFSNGTTVNNRCISIIDAFTFDGRPVITDAYSFPCATGLAEVAIVAEGVAPLTYKITTKNGAAFEVNNGTSNLFSNLEPATYNFQVSDICGNLRNIQFDITALEPMEIVATDFCPGQPGSLSIQGFSFLTYQWWKGNDTAAILSTSSVLNFASFDAVTGPGTYHVEISSSNPNSCMNQTLSFTIPENTMPNAGDDNSITLCNNGLPLNLNAYLSAQHDANGTWQDISATGNLNGSALEINGLAAGTYNFTYTVNGMCGITDEATITITLNDIPGIPVVNVVSPVCEGETVFLTADAVPGAVYSWTGPGGFTSSQQNPVLTNTTVSQSGVYLFMVTVNDCPSEAVHVNVSINPKPDFTIAGNAAICSGRSTVLTVSPENFTPNTTTAYTWYFNNNVMNGVDSSAIEVFDTGVYRVEVSHNGCTFEKQLEVTESTADFEVNLAQGCKNYNYMLYIENAEDLEGYTVLWTGPDGFTSNEFENDISGFATGVYTVMVTGPNGCYIEESIEVKNTNCTIPRGISPNNDGKNDSFDISYLNAKDIKIFNRYGLKVYEKQNYRNEWHGQSDKGNLPTGTYYYVITLSEGKRVTGWVYLLREHS